MNIKTLGIKVLLLSTLILGFNVFAADQPDSVRLSQDGKQTVYSGTGLQSLLKELGQLGIDPNKLRAVDQNGNIITPFTPGAEVTWTRTADNINVGGKLRPNDLSSGTGTPGQIQVDTVRSGNTVYVFTWQYQKLPDGTYGWVALGVTSYTIQVNTSQK